MEEKKKSNTKTRTSKKETSVKKKDSPKKKTTNRINANKKTEIKNTKPVEKNEREANRTTTFNLIEVIIIMIITAIFGILIGSCATYFKDKVIDNNIVPSELEEFVDIYNKLSDDYYSQTDKKELLEAGIKGMVNYLGDPYTSYLDYDSTYSLNEELKGEFVGMGATVSLDDEGKIYIVEVMADSPAEKAGFLVGDVITKVGDKSTDGLNTAEVSYLIKGKENTNVDITISRAGEEKVINLKRGKVELQSVSYDFLDDGNVGYMNISIFAKNTSSQFKKAMDDFIKSDVKSIVIDVRDNSGGYLETAEEITSLFLDKGDTIYQLDTKGKIESIKNKKDKKYDIPIAILIDSSTASASELLAASLNENLNAPLIGIKTFGKGTVQKTKKLSSGSMIKYTVQEWLTPKGNSVNLVGIKPNYEVQLSEEYCKNPTIENDNQLQKAIEVAKNIKK